MSQIDESTSLSKGLLLGLLAGGTVGAALALLFAPKTGKELRADIQERSGEYIDKAGVAISTALDSAQQIVTDGRVRADKIVEDAKSKASTILSDAEKIVTEAKSKASTQGGQLKESLSKISEAAKAGVDTFRSEFGNSKQSV